MAIWRSRITKLSLVIWLCRIVKRLLAILRQPIAKLMLEILATSYCLNRNNRVSSFYWIRGSKQCFLTCFSYFSRYFHNLVFSRNCYLINSSRPSQLHGNPISRPVSCAIGTPSQYIVHAPPCFWNRTHRFLEARCLWEPGSILTTGEFSLFCFLPKVSAANIHWTEHNSYLSYSQNPQTDTFLRDLGFAKLRSRGWVWNHQGISKLVNGLIVACQMTASLRFAQSNSADLPRHKCFAVGSSTYPCHMACISKPVMKDITSLSD